MRSTHTAAGLGLGLAFVLGACASAPAPRRSDAAFSVEAALHLLETTDTFADTAVGFAGAPSKQACAFAVVLRQRDAGLLFRSLLAKGQTAGQLYALCGLYVTDPAVFREAVEPYRRRSDDVKTFMGCIGARQRVRDLVEHSGPHAVRLSSPQDTLQAWVKRHPESSRALFLDILGGGYPATFRAMRPCRGARDEIN